jgi:CMP-N,N'-diacetyllegionaminic acid synthase
MPDHSERKVIGVVVGRKNSKGLPGKNMKSFNGLPLVEWTMRQAKDSRCLTRVIVSSDDDEILALGEKYGFVSIERPAELATDDAPIGAAILEALIRSQIELEDSDVIVLLEPTSPLRPKGFIDECVTKFLASNANSSVSIGLSNSQHPLFSLVRKANGELLRYDGQDLRYIRRQELEDVHFLDGSFYSTELGQLKISSQMYGGKVLGLPVEKWQEVEIDDEIDFAIAERLGEIYAAKL